MRSKGNNYQQTDRNPAGLTEQLCGLRMCQRPQWGTGLTEWTENASNLFLCCWISKEGSRLANCVIYDTQITDIQYASSRDGLHAVPSYFGETWCLTLAFWQSFVIFGGWRLYKQLLNMKGYKLTCKNEFTSVSIALLENNDFIRGPQPGLILVPQGKF